MEKAKVEVTIEEQPWQSTVEVDVSVAANTVLVPSDGNPKMGTSVVQPDDICALMDVKRVAKAIAKSMVAGGIWDLRSIYGRQSEDKMGDIRLVEERGSSICISLYPKTLPQGRETN